MNSLKKEKTQVLVLGTMHKFHKNHSAWLIDKIAYKLIRNCSL